MHKGIALAMWRKAQRLIAKDARAAWTEANIKNGRKLKRHRPYTLPQRAEDLVEALGRGDAERVAWIFFADYEGRG